MKKKVLFALIALFSFLSSWADDVTVGEGENAYKVSLSTQYVALDATNGVDAPTIAGPTVYKGTSGSFTATVACVVDAEGHKVDGKIKTAGTYYLLVNFKDGEAKVFKVPFYVTAPVGGTAEYVYDATTWGKSKTVGALKDYYAKYPFEDLWGKPNGSNEEERCATITDRRCTFTSYASATGTEAYATGIVQILEQKWDDDWTQILWTKVKVVNNGSGPEGFLNRTFYIKGGPDVLPDNPVRYQLYAEANGTGLTNEQDIWVEISEYAAPGFTQTWEGCINAPASKLPWICVNYDGEPKAVVFTYEGLNSVFPWGKDRLFGEDKTWGVASVAQEFKQNDFLDPNAKFAGDNGWNNTKGNASTFDINKFNMLLIPADLVLTATVENATDLTDDANVTISCNSLPYNGAVQHPTFSGEKFNATVTYTPATTGEAITLVEGRDFTPVYEVAGDDYKSADTHKFTVNFIGAYAGSKAATYDIEKAHVNINLAYIYKTYGEADPKDPADFNFEIDASTPLKGADVKSDIAKYLVFQRASGDQNVGEDVKEYEYYYGKTADFEEKCNYSISFLQTKSLLIIQPKEVKINVTPVYKKYHQTVELKYDADALKAQLAEADKIKATGTPGKDDIITSITWEGAGTDAGEAVNADLEGTAPNQTVAFRNQGTGYPMTATAAIVPATKKSNYTVTVINPEKGFAIVPTDEAKITVEIPTKDDEGHDINGAVNGKFIYKAAAYEPAPIVKDGGFTLKEKTSENPDGDYTVSWAKNVDAGDNTAECIVTLCGSYTSATPITKKFTISKADLVVKPVSATAEGGYRIAYETFKGSESAQSEYQRNTSTDVYFSVDPAAITVKKGAEIEQDVYVLKIQLPTGVEVITAKNYNVEIADALLALNNKPILRVRPARNQPGKVYDGEEPTAEELQGLLIEVQHATENGYEAATTDEIAALKILGKPVYTITKAEGVDVGLYRLTVNGPAVLKDYNVEYDNTHGAQSDRNYPITPAAYFIVVNNDPAKLGTASKTYGEDDPEFTLTAATRTGEGTTASPYVYTAAAGVTVPDAVRAVHLNNYYGADDAGTHDILVQRRIGNNNWNWQAFRNWEVGNYIFTSVNGVLTIAKKAVTFKAEDKSKVYGTDDPDLTIVPDPIVTRYTEPLSKTEGKYDAFDITREAGDAVGTYTITLAVKDMDPATPGLQLHNSLRNYEVDVQPGTFTINKATYFVRANDQWIHFYNEINPLDVTIDLPGGKTLKWQKAGINESAEQTAAREANNAQIEALGSLTVVEGKDAIGANMDAYKWNAKTNANYALATGEAGSKTIPATAHTREYVYTDGFCNGYLTVYSLEYIPLENAELAELLGKEADAAGAQPSLLQKVLEAHKGLTIPVKMPARKLAADEWYTFVLPFEVTPSTLFSSDYFGYGAAEILDASKSVGNNVVFSLQVAKPIPANTPFILKVGKEVSAEDMNAMWFNGVTIDNSINYLTENPTTGKAGNVQFVGLYYDKQGFTADQRYNAKVGNVDPRGFYPGGDNSGSIVVKRTNAYLQFPSAGAAAKARIFIEDENGTLTEINGVAAEADAAVAGEGWYTISGVKLNAQPTEKGIYIFNGKKVAIQ